MQRRYRLFILLTGVVVEATAVIVIIRAFCPSGNPLFAAVLKNDADKVYRCIRDGQNPNVKNELGLTPLHFAAANGLERCAEALLDSGASIDLADNKGNTALHFAALDNRVRMVKLLLENGARPNVRNSCGEAPLHFAAGNLGRASAEALLGGGALVDPVDAKGRTPLFGAVNFGDDPTVVLLVQHGASLSVKDAEGKGLVDVADGKTRTVDLLSRLATQPSSVE